MKTLYESTPKDVQKWGDYAASTVQSNVEPYKKVSSLLITLISLIWTLTRLPLLLLQSVADFRQNYLSWAPDLSYLKEEGDGIIKPTWNKGVAWTIEVLKDSPQAIKHWSQIGWDKITEFTNEQQPATAQENKPWRLAVYEEQLVVKYE